MMNIHRLVRFSLFFLIPSALAVEIGNGPYIPGSFSTVLDMTPNKPGWAFRYDYQYYTGSISAGRPLALGGGFTGELSLDIDANYSLHIFRLVHTFKQKILGAHCSLVAAMPFMNVNVVATSTVKLPGGGKIKTTMSDSNSGFTDIVFIPIAMNWTVKDFQFNFQVPIYAPVGEYTPGRLANPGKNRWVFDPLFFVNWFNPKIGLEITGNIGMAFSTYNYATDYQNGVVFHSEGTIMQYFPLGNQTYLGIGGNWLVYQQLSPDTGSGAQFGSFYSNVFGAGPCLILSKAVGNTKIAAQVKWLPEIEATNHFKGNSIWVTAGILF